MLVKTKAEEVGRKPANFYCRSSIFSGLVFPEASCVKCECCLFLNSSFMNHCPLLPRRGKTYGLDADRCQHISCRNYVMSSVVTDKVFFFVPTAVYRSFTLTDAANVWQTLCFSVFIQFLCPVQPGVAFSSCQY